LNNETELDNPIELSLQERMNLSVKGYKNALIGIGIVAIVILIASAYRTIFFYANIDLVVSPEVANVLDAMNTLGIFILLVSVGCVFWVLKAGRKIYGENESINREYTQQNYLLALSVSGREHKEADLDFFNIARDIFPELKKLDIESVKKFGEEMEVEELTVEITDYLGRKKSEYIFDIVTDTDDGRFVIKHFKKKASYDDLKECLTVVKDQGWSSVLRLVCMAEDFDSDILKKYEKLEVDTVPLDLILVNEKGFQTLKISDKN